VKDKNLLVRGLSVLEQLTTQAALSTEQVSATTGIPKPSAYRILCTLEHAQYVIRKKDGPEDIWSVDLSFLALSANILSRLDLRTDLRDILIKLADDTREIVQLAIWHRDRVVIVDNIKRYDSLVSFAREGASLHINSCVAGFVFGAFNEETEVESALKGDLPRSTKYTITDPARLRKMFARVRDLGYGVDDQYRAEGHRCVGAPVFDHTGHIVAEINISGHIQTLTDGTLQRYALKVIQRAAEASERLGYRKTLRRKHLKN